jgi:hypothetical protein
MADGGGDRLLVTGYQLSVVVCYLPLVTWHLSDGGIIPNGQASGINLTGETPVPPTTAGRPTARMRKTNDVTRHVTRWALPRELPFGLHRALGRQFSTRPHSSLFNLRETFGVPFITATWSYRRPLWSFYRTKRMPFSAGR